MSGFLRPQATAVLYRWREIIAGGVALGGGLLLTAQIGYVQQGLGWFLCVLSVGYIVLGLRRLRFAGSADAPGMVTVDEGQIGYFAPNIGGHIDIAELLELRLRNDQGRLSWFLITPTHALAIPHDAVGADQLFDVFSALPDLSSMVLVRAVKSARPGTTRVWRNTAVTGLTALR